tara:strand:- start:1453 stop:2370 length:918 start_codon:yes stop_codon:yes gene_type:complete
MQNDKKPFQTTTAFHLAGIVPIAGQPLDFKMDFPDCMMPISQNYTLVEHAVYECAMAGCETIWLICNDDIAPLIRYRVGDYIQDPVYVNRKSKFPSLQKVRIPIFYVPIHPKDRDKRDCLSWSVIHGALTSLQVSSQLSKWVIPDKYYVSFPYGVFPVEEVREHRKIISSNRNFYLAFQNKTVQDNYYCSFTFGKEEFIQYRRNIRQKGTGMYTMDEVDERGIPRSILPIDKRYSARFFDLKDVFTDLDLGSALVVEPTDFMNISSWSEYRNYMSSPLSEVVVRPWEGIMKYKEFNPIGVDTVDE